MLFKYKAKNAEGKIKEGELEAESQLELARSLREQGFYIIEAESEEAEKDSSKSKQLAQLDLKVVTEKIKGVALEEKMMFSRNLSVMISSGIPLTRALEVLKKQTQSPTFKKTITKVISDVQKGTSFSDAIGKHPKVFSRLYVSMIKAGEATGTMDDTLNTLSDQLEKQHELRAKIRGAMTYPIVIIIAMIVIGILMMIMVIPQLKDVFSSVDAELPATTQFIISLSDFLAVYWWTLLIIIPAFVFALVKISKTPWGGRGFAWMFLRAPVVKELSKKINNATFSRTLSSLINGGVPILEALKITSDTVTNVYYRESILEASTKVQKGNNLYEVLKTYPKLYTPLMLEMIEVGEESGKLSDLLQRVAEFYEAEVSDATDNMSSIIEPILMLVIGGVVGFFAVSIMQPIYGMLGNI